MRHHDAPRFGQLLHAARATLRANPNPNPNPDQARATLREHRAARESICAELQLIWSGPGEERLLGL